MTIYERIKQDHEKHRELMREIESTVGSSRERIAQFNRLKDDVTAHANAEEQVFYAELMRIGESQEQARHSVAEHQQADDLFEHISETDLSSSGWLVSFKKLKDELEHHMEEEEEEVFALAQKVISSHRAREMAKEFDDIKAGEKKLVA